MVCLSVLHDLLEKFSLREKFPSQNSLIFCSNLLVQKLSISKFLYLEQYFVSFSMNFHSYFPWAKVFVSLNFVWPTRSV